MFALIQNNEISYFVEEIPKDGINFDFAIDIGSFDLKKDYKYIDGKIIETWKDGFEPEKEITDQEKEIIEKQSMIDEIKDIGKQGEELRSKYLSAELLPESEIKTETLRILKEKGDLIMSQYVEKQKILVEK